MKKNVTLSSYCLIVSALTTALICGVFVYTLKSQYHPVSKYIWGAAAALLIISALCYMPISITLDDKHLRIRRPLKTKNIPVAEISGVRLCAPTMGAKRICGSGGWFGWYGRFKENDLGNYFAYYGKASDCFLVTLKNGKKYMLGCNDAPDMVKAIADKITN